jgi:hypothetical protein
MIYFMLLSLPLLVAPLRTLPHTKRPYQCFVVLYFIALLLLTGLRWNMGTDWDSYHQYFTDQDNYHFFEVGYVVFTAAVKSVTNNYSIFLLIDASLALIPIWYVLHKQTGCAALSLAIFFSYYFTIHYIGSNRRIISIGLCFLALHALTKKKSFAFLALCGVSFCFHRSSLIFLRAWPIYTMKPRNWVYTALIVVAILIEIANPLANAVSLLGGSTEIVLVNKVLGYSDNNFLDENVNYGVQNLISIAKRSIFLGLVLWAYSKQREDKKKEYGGLLNLYLFSFVLYIMFTGTVEIFKSLTIYFSIVEVVLIPVALLSIKKHIRPLAYALFACFLFAQQYSALKSYWDLYIPYRSVLSENTP